MELNTLSGQIVHCAVEVHKALGPGLLESAYSKCLQFELTKAGLSVEAEKPLPLIYGDVKLEAGYRVDLLVEKAIVIEVKAVESLTNVHVAQVLTYLKLSGCKLGLLMNFNVALMKHGIRRLIL